MNVLVLNLTRLGDLLQSQPAIAGLKAAGHRVGLVCLENFAPAAELMQGVDELFAFPGARMLSRLATDWRRALAAHREVKEEVLRRLPPDVVINLTPSEPARLLALSLKPLETRGFALDEFGFNADASLWAAFLQLAARSRGASPFNVVDLFRRISGLAGAPGGPDGSGGFGLRGPSGDQKAQARRQLLSLFPAPPEKGLVALQLGASEDRRRWPVERFAELARRLSASGYGPVLVGTEAERPLGERLKTLAGVPVADVMGATDLPGLAAVLANCGLLATNDTGTMHLAAAVGVPCLAIFLATAQPWDTGPYLPGCLCLEPDISCHPCAFGTGCPRNEACRQVIGAADVAELALGMLSGRTPERAQAEGARVWRSVMGAGPGADGLLDLASLSGHEAEDRTRLIRLQRALYRRYLDGEALDGLELPPAGLSRDATQALSGRLKETSGLLFLLRRQGELLAREPVAAMKTKFLATWQRVQGVLGAEDRLGVLAALWLFESERPGLGLEDILSLATRFGALSTAMLEKIDGGTHAA